MPPSGGFYVFHPWSLLGEGTIAGLRWDTISQGGQMQSYQCPFCKAQFSGEDKSRDIAIDSGRCPECFTSLPHFPPSLLPTLQALKSGATSLEAQASTGIAGPQNVAPLSAPSPLPSTVKAEVSSGFNRQIQDLIVTAIGVIASMATAIALFLIEDRLGIAIYSYMLWFVIPAGAFLSGFVAAGGWYLGSILFNHRPTRLLLVHMGLASV